MGLSLVRQNGSVRFPEGAVNGYTCSPAANQHEASGLRAKDFLSRQSCTGYLSAARSFRIILTPAMLERLGLEVGMRLFAIRSSNISFTMGAKGLLSERVKSYSGELPAF